MVYRNSRQKDNAVTTVHYQQGIDIRIWHIQKIAFNISCLNERHWATAVLSITRSVQLMPFGMNDKVCVLREIGE